MTLRAVACAALLSLTAMPAVAADQALVDAAKREGQVVWYTTQRAPFPGAVADAFRAKYGVEVKFAIYSAAEVPLRVSNEGKAGNQQADVFDGTEGVPSLKLEGLVLKWQPDSAKRLAPQFVDPNGYWVATNVYVLSPAFNTNLVPKGSEPKTFEDLLDPRWKGKMVWSATPTMTGPGGFIGAVLDRFGEEKGMDYLRKLHAQNITPILGSPATLNQVVTGEFPIALHVFSGQVADAMGKGVPISWIPMEPAVALLAVVGQPVNAPYPNAGKLLMDFLVSPEGQQIYAQHGHIGVDPAAKAKDAELRPDGIKYRAIYFSPDQIAQLAPRYAGIFRDIFR